MKYFKLTEFGKENWFINKKATTEKIYTFPIVVWDNGETSDLNRDVERWTKEMIFVSEEEYVRQNNYLTDWKQWKTTTLLQAWDKLLIPEWFKQPKKSKPLNRIITPSVPNLVQWQWFSSKDPTLNYNPWNY